MKITDKIMKACGFRIAYGSGELAVYRHPLFSQTYTIYQIKTLDKLCELMFNKGIEQQQHNAREALKIITGGKND